MWIELDLPPRLRLAAGVEEEREMEATRIDDTDRDPGAACWQCGGDGWGIVGQSWASDDPINGPYDGEVEKCPNCRGSGKAKDCWYW